MLLHRKRLNQPSDLKETEQTPGRDTQQPTAWKKLSPVELPGKDMFQPVGLPAYCTVCPGYKGTLYTLWRCHHPCWGWGALVVALTLSYFCSCKKLWSDSLGAHLLRPHVGLSFASCLGWINVCSHFPRNSVTHMYSVRLVFRESISVFNRIKGYWGGGSKQVTCLT